MAAFPGCKPPCISAAVEGGAGAPVVGSMQQQAGNRKAATATKSRTPPWKAVFHTITTVHFLGFALFFGIMGLTQVRNYCCVCRPTSRRSPRLHPAFSRSMHLLHGTSCMKRATHSGTTLTPLICSATQRLCLVPLWATGYVFAEATPSLTAPRSVTRSLLPHRWLLAGTMKLWERR